MLVYYNIIPCNLEWDDLSPIEAFACSLCRLCTAVCPEKLELADIFWEKRIEAINEGYISPDDFSYLLPDKYDNSIKQYLQEERIDYSELENIKSETAFFPGCSLLAYAPSLSGKTLRALEGNLGTVTMLTDCCGKVLEQFGVIDRRDSFTSNLEEKYKEQGIKKIITACPNCYYFLREKLPEMEVETVYSYLSGLHMKAGSSANKKIAFHDSCPDRFEKLFMEPVRELLFDRGFQFAEMEHSKELALCCGSGGQVRHFDEERVIKKQEKRVEEAKKLSVDIICCYCMSCVLKLAPIFKEHGIEVKHTLELLLG